MSDLSDRVRAAQEFSFANVSNIVKEMNVDYVDGMKDECERRRALDDALSDAVGTLELVQGQCGIPDAGDACRAILRTTREALTRIERALEGK